MVIVMQEGATDAQIQHVIDRLVASGFNVHRSTGESHTVLGAVGVHREFDHRDFELLEGVREVMRITQPFKLASRQFKPEGTIVDLGRGVKIGGPQVAVAAGPCSVESREQIHSIAESVSKAGAKILRGGAFKPRTSPYAFQGMGEPGLKLMREAADKFGLFTISEVMDASQIQMMLGYVDIFQVGARNMQNYYLLRALGEIRKPVLLKRGMSATMEELLMSAEYILAGGNYNVILCERGIRTFETYTRNTLDIAAIPVIKKLSHLPMLADPSHGTGRRDKVPPMARAAVAAGADGLLIEVHNDPDHALSDGAQSLEPATFTQLMAELRIIAPAIGRRIAQAAAELFSSEKGPLFLGGHPMAGRELPGIAHADADIFRENTYALIAESAEAVVAGLKARAATVEEPEATHDPRIGAFVKILEKVGARPLWLGAPQHDYAVGLASHLPQLAAVALASFLYDRLDENGLLITLAGPGLRDSLRLAGSPYSTWRDIDLTNQEVLSAALDLFARRLDDLREKLASRELEADFEAANELYKLLRSL